MPTVMNFLTVMKSYLNNEIPEAKLFEGFDSVLLDSLTLSTGRFHLWTQEAIREFASSLNPMIADIRQQTGKEPVMLEISAGYGDLSSGLKTLLPSVRIIPTDGFYSEILDPEEKHYDARVIQARGVQKLSAKDIEDGRFRALLGISDDTPVIIVASHLPREGDVEKELLNQHQVNSVMLVSAYEPQSDQKGTGQRNVMANPVVWSTQFRSLNHDFWFSGLLSPEGQLNCRLETFTRIPGYPRNEPGTLDVIPHPTVSSPIGPYQTRGLLNQLSDIIYGRQRMPQGPLFGELLDRSKPVANYQYPLRKPTHVTTWQALSEVEVVSANEFLDLLSDYLGAGLPRLDILTAIYEKTHLTLDQAKEFLEILDRHTEVRHPVTTVENRQTKAYFDERLHHDFPDLSAPTNSPTAEPSEDELVSRVKEVYSREAKQFQAIYGKQVAGINKEFIERLLQRLPASGGVLDVGTGPGLHAAYIADTFKANHQSRAVVGVDISHDQIEIARTTYADLLNTYPGLQFQEMDARHLNDNFAAGSIAGILDMGAFHFLPAEAQARVLKQHFDLLKDGGVLFMSVKKGPKTIATHPRYGGPEIPMSFFESKEDLANFARQAGFEVSGENLTTQINPITHEEWIYLLAIRPAAAPKPQGPGLRTSVGVLATILPLGPGMKNYSKLSLGDLFSLHAQTFKPVVNPDNNPEYVGVSIAAGMGISDYLLAGNIQDSLFVDPIYKNLTTGKINAFLDAFRRNGFTPEQAFVAKTYREWRAFEGFTNHSLFTELPDSLLVALVCDLQDMDPTGQTLASGKAIDIQEGKEHFPALQFTWKYPNEEPKDYQIVFVDADINGPWPDYLESRVKRGLRFVYQRAAMKLPFDPAYLKRMSPYLDGFYLGDDIAVEYTAERQVIQDMQSQFPLEAPIVRVPMAEAIRQEILRRKIEMPGAATAVLSANHRYDWDLNLRQWPPAAHPAAAKSNLVGRGIAFLMLIPGALVTFVLLPLIYWGLPGSIKFKDVRVGFEGKDIRVTKIRTLTSMRKYGYQKLTAYGRFARPIRIDEWPFFWMIWTGKMRWFGPRVTQRWELSDDYTDQVLSLTSPGLLSWNNLRRVVIDELGLPAQTIADRTAYDLVDINTATPWNRIRLVLASLTIWAALFWHTFSPIQKDLPLIWLADQWNLFSPAPPNKKSLMHRAGQIAFIAMIFVAGAILFSMYLGPIGPDAFTYFAGPHLIHLGANPYDWDAFKQLYLNGAFNHIRHLPIEGSPGEINPYIASPINMLLYSPFRLIRDYRVYENIYLATYFFAVTGSVYLWAKKIIANPTARALGALGFVILLFHLSEAFRLSVSMGQIDYLYIFPMAWGVYLFSQNMRNESTVKPMGAGFLLSLAGFIKVFPFILPLSLSGAAVVAYLRTSASNRKRYFQSNVFLAATSSVVSAALLLVVTSVYPGVQAYAQWLHVWTNFPSVYGAAYLHNFVDVLLNYVPSSAYVFYLAYAIMVCLAWRFLFGKPGHFNDLDMAGMMALLPTFMPAWQSYYDTVLLVPFLIALTHLYKRPLNRVVKLAAAGGLSMIFLLTQMTYGMIPFKFLDTPLPNFLYRESPYDQMRTLAHFLLYPASLMLWGFIWRLKSSARHDNDGARTGNLAIAA